jgi:curli biogenesis system outer membrane secretion channel CsgG
MNMSKWIILGAAAVVGAQTPAWALWGKKDDGKKEEPKTEAVKTERANADLKLGEYKGLKHAVGCKDFDNEAGWHGEWELGQNLSIMLESALYDSGRFVIVEREKLKDVMLEQDLAASGRTAAQKKVAQTGMIRPAKYLATGAVTEVSDATAGGAGGVRIGGFNIGGGKSQSRVTIIAKLIDTTTGEIVAKERIVGKPGSTALKVGYSGSDFGVDLGGFKKSAIGQAAQDAINQAAAFIAKQMEEFPFEGSVIKVTESGQVIINRGSEFGVEAGQELVIATEGEKLIDPDSGAVLGQEEGKVIGKLKVAKVAEKISYCEVTEGEKSPKTGSVVKAAN